MENGDWRSETGYSRMEMGKRERKAERIKGKGPKGGTYIDP
jgi:hypothetical protein